jgi:hypothetical protein
MSHYWGIFIIWLMLPFVMFLISGKLASSWLTLKLFNALKNLILIAMVVLTIVNFMNISGLQAEIGKQFFDGYRIEKHYSSEKDFDDICFDENKRYINSSSTQCAIEDLSEVSWFGHIFLYLMSWLSILLLAGIPIATIMIGNSVKFRRELDG